MLSTVDVSRTFVVMTITGTTRLGNRRPVPSVHKILFAPRMRKTTELDLDERRATRFEKLRYLPLLERVFPTEDDAIGTLDRDVEGHESDRSQPPPHRRRLRPAWDDAIRRGHAKSQRITSLVPNLDRDGLGARWPLRWLDQRARRREDRQRDAEGDGPQHDAIVACR